MTLIKIRKVISGIFFVLFVLAFLGAGKLSDFLAQALPPLQLAPSLMRTILHPEILFAAGLLFILLITLVFGRVYCSFLCPLGTLQDCMSAGSRRIGIRPGYAFAKPCNFLRYTILALTAATALLGSLLLLGLLDPYALTGRILTHFLQPLAGWIYNAAISLLKSFDIYGYTIQTASIPASVAAVTTGFFLLVLYLSARHGRLYCNTICPVGTLLGLLSHFSVFKFTLDQKGCSACVRCEAVCKAGCIDPQTATIDMSRCVGCFNCLDACGKATISYRPSFGNMPKSDWSPARRRFVVSGIAAAGSLLLFFNAGIRAYLGTFLAKADSPVTPPGSRSAARFIQACTACSLCVSACPTQVLTPTLLDYGPTGLLQPKMNYEKSFCDFECNICGKVCPTGAIAPITLNEKKLTQIGEAGLLEDICVVFVDHNNCGACGEVCPTHAISFVDKHNILYPEIDPKYCIGCGACQLACPTAPKSIVIRSNPVHKKAEKYVHPETPIEQKKSSDKDFPF